MNTVHHPERAPYRTEEIELAQALAHQMMLAIRLNEVGEQIRQTAVVAERNRMARDVISSVCPPRYSCSRVHWCNRAAVHALRPQSLEQDDFWYALKGIVKTTTLGTTL